MHYKIGKLTFNILVEENEDIALFDGISATFSGRDLNKIYQHQFHEYLGKDYEVGLKWEYFNEIKDQLDDLETDNPDTDLDFLLNDYDFIIYNLDDMAVLFKMFIEYCNRIKSERTIDIKCSHPFEFFFIVCLTEHVDLDDTLKFYDHYYNDYYNYSNTMVQAYRKMCDAGLGHLYNKDLYYQMEDNVDMLFDLPLESSELLEKLDN